MQTSPFIFSRSYFEATVSGGTVLVVAGPSAELKQSETLVPTAFPHRSQPLHQLPASNELQDLAPWYSQAFVIGS